MYQIEDDILIFESMKNILCQLNDKCYGFFLAATSTGMPRKIGFTVVDSSSHEGNFSASELMRHAPTVSGWRSSR